MSYRAPGTQWSARRRGILNLEACELEHGSFFICALYEFQNLTWFHAALPGVGANVRSEALRLQRRTRLATVPFDTVVALSPSKARCLPGTFAPVSAKVLSYKSFSAADLVRFE